MKVSYNYEGYFQLWRLLSIMWISGWVDKVADFKSLNLPQVEGCLSPTTDIYVGKLEISYGQWGKVLNFLYRISSTVIFQEQLLGKMLDCK